MEAFTVTTTLGQADWRDLVRQVRRRAWRRAGPMPGRLVALFFWVCAVVVLIWLTLRWPARFSAASMALGVLLFGTYLLILTARHRRGLRPTQGSRMFETTTYEFGPDGFQVRRRDLESRCKWGLVREIEATPRHIFLWLDGTTAYVIRVADLPPPMTADNAVARLRSVVVSDRENAATPR